MLEPWCLGPLCFVPAPETPLARVFGFPELLSALALFVVVYTVSDTRYKLRVNLAPQWLFRATFWIVSVIAICALLTDVWVAQRWWLIRTAHLETPFWQGILGGLFLLVFLTWMYFAFIKPAKFTERNSDHFANVVVGYVSSGNEAQLIAVASELYASADSLVTLCPTYDEVKTSNETYSSTGRATISEGRQRAWDLMLLMANPRLCRQIVSFVPQTAWAFLDAATDQSKYDFPLGPMVQAITAEAISNKESLLHHENKPFHTDLIGRLKMWSERLYGNYDLIQGLAERGGSPLQLQYDSNRRWDDEHWSAYCRTVILTMRGFLKSGKFENAYIIYQGFSEIEHAFSSLRELSNIEKDVHKNVEHKKLRVVVDFIDDAIELLAETKVKPWERRTTEKSRGQSSREIDIFDRVAELICDVCIATSRVEGSDDKIWAIHFLTVWHHIFASTKDSPARRVVLRRARRRLYDTVKEIETRPHYVNAPLLGFLLNVIGLEPPKKKSDAVVMARPLLAMTKRSYRSLREKYPEVAQSVLMGNLHYDGKTNRLFRTYARGLRGEAPRVFLDLDPPKAGMFDQWL